MCKPRFGVTGIYFDALEPSVPREDYLQSLIATLPVSEKRLASIAPKLVNKEQRIEEKLINTPSVGRIHGRQCQPARDKKGRKRTLLSSSSSSSSTSSSATSSSSLASSEGLHHRSAKRLKAKKFFISSNRSKVSSSLSSDEQRPKNLTKAGISKPGSANYITSKKLGPSTPYENGDGRRTSEGATKRPQSNKVVKPGKGSTLSEAARTGKATEPSKSPPSKKVRFAMDVQQRLVPSEVGSDTSSSSASDDSYIDSPPPIDTQDAFSGYHRPANAPRPYKTDSELGRVGRSQEEKELYDSSQTLDARSGFPHRSSRHFTQSKVHSQDRLPNPILILRSAILGDGKGKRKPGNRLRMSGDSVSSRGSLSSSRASSSRQSNRDTAPKSTLLRGYKIPAAGVVAATGLQYEARSRSYFRDV